MTAICLPLSARAFGCGLGVRQRSDLVVIASAVNDAEMTRRLSFVVWAFLEGCWISADFGAGASGKPNGRGPSEDVQLRPLASDGIANPMSRRTRVGGVR